MTRHTARRRAVTLACTGAMLAALPALPATAEVQNRVDLRVLLVTDGSPSVEAIRTQLATEGVPTTVVDLRDAARPVITSAFLSDQVGANPRAKFQSVVLTDARGGTWTAGASSLATTELDALHAFEAAFGVRQVDAYVYPDAAVGMTPTGRGVTLDGTSATVTSTGLGGAFSYLKGTVAVEDNDPGVLETYGYEASPAGPEVTPLVTTSNGPLVASYAKDGREELFLTAGYNAGHLWWRTLGHGVITWMTKGVHLGYARNYFAVQVDDVLLPDARWSTTGNCTPGDDCAAGVPATRDIRMTAADVSYLVNWQKSRGYQLDMTFNAAGSADAIADSGTGKDPLTDALLANKGSLRWLNHTYSHPFLGCVQDFTVIPWRCATDATGATLYASQQQISDEISQNLQWAAANKVPLTATDLVTGEHSGLRTLPQQPNDNPNLAPALVANGITSIASDASREPAQRTVGSAKTVMRHPMNVFYNVATAAEEVDEYNWIYTSQANGGSGLCTAPNSTCIAPLDPATGYADYIVPLETRIAYGHVVGNDPRPHYVHQSNLAEGRIAYAVIDGVLDRYRATFATNAPVQNLRLGQQGLVLERAAAWAAAQSAVTAYTLGGKLYVSTTSKSKVFTPVTVPSNVGFGTGWGGERSDYTGINSKTGLTLSL